MRNFVIAAAAAVLATGCATGHIQDHSGFHFHAELGAGNNDTDVTYAGETGKVSGGGGSFSIAAGGALAPNLILGGEVWGVGASEPDVREFGGSRGTLVDVTYSAYGVGPRVTWYVMPANVYFSLTPSFTQLAFSDDYSDYSEESRWGLGLRREIERHYPDVR